MDCGLAAIDVELLIGIVLRIVFGAGPECILDRFLVVAGLAAAFRCSGRLAALTVLFVLGVGLLGRIDFGFGLRSDYKSLVGPRLVLAKLCAAFRCRDRFAVLTVLPIFALDRLLRLILGVGLRTPERRLLDPCLIFRGVVRAFALRSRGGDRDVATGYQRKRGGCWPDKRTEVGFY